MRTLPARSSIEKRHAQLRVSSAQSCLAEIPPTAAAAMAMMALVPFRSPTALSTLRHAAVGTGLDPAEFAVGLAAAQERGAARLVADGAGGVLVLRGGRA